MMNLPICFLRLPGRKYFSSRKLVFNRIKHCRRIAPRYDKQAANFFAGIKLTAIRLWLRVYGSTSRYVFASNRDGDSTRPLTLSKEPGVSSRNNNLSGSTGPGKIKRPSGTRENPNWV